MTNKRKPTPPWHDQASELDLEIGRGSWEEFWEEKMADEISLDRLAHTTYPDIKPENCGSFEAAFGPPKAARDD